MKQNLAMWEFYIKISTFDTFSNLGDQACLYKGWAIYMKVECQLAQKRKNSNAMAPEKSYQILEESECMV